jgi:predicted ester cyclase
MIQQARPPCRPLNAFTLSDSKHTRATRSAEPSMTDDTLDAQYRRYIAWLNDRRFGELDDFVHEQLVYNGRPMTRIDYQDLIGEDFAAIPDLFFKIEHLVVRGEMVAARLNFNCTPRGEFLGLRPNGKSISFSEHVFYRFRDGKIQEVWSIIDKAAVEAQLAV